MNVYQNADNRDRLSIEYTINESNANDHVKEFSLCYSNESWASEIKGKEALKFIDDGNQIIIKTDNGKTYKLDYSLANQIFIALLYQNELETEIKEERLIKKTK